MSAPPPDYQDYPEWDYPPPGYGPPSYSPPGYPPSAYPPPNYPPQPYPPPGYPPPGYPPPHYPGAPPRYPPGPGYVSQPGYRGAQPQLRHTQAAGIIPLRPLNLSDIFNGATIYIRANPRATLGLTAIVVVITQVITLIAAAGPLAAASRLRTAPPDELSSGDVVAWILSATLTGLVGWLAGTLLTGMLTVIVGRAVFGSTITAGETWAKIRGRLPALIGLVALESAGMILLCGLAGLILGALGTAANPAAAVLIGFPLVLVVFATVVYCYTMLSFAPALTVLERLPVIDAITRSFALVRNSFWRVFGIRSLTWLVAFLIAGAVAAPFGFLGHLLVGPTLAGVTVAAVGSAIGRIITAPFTAGVDVLLYTDRRIRAEAFDLVLQTGATGNPAFAASTDYLWLTRPV